MANFSFNSFRPTISLLISVVVCVGCTRTQYRQQADRDAYCAIGEKNGDHRWRADRFTIELDPRSRYFDPHDPDCSPMPKDDPAAHRFMHQVNGMKGWEHWYDNGVRKELENPQWRDRLGEYVEVSDDGAIKLDIDTALRLAYVHSPNHQTQRETVYLAALDVVEERFALDTQFFGGYDLGFNHQGSLAPASIAFDGSTSQYSVNGPRDRAESSRVTLGRGSGAAPALQLSRQFATAGTLLAGFANSLVVEFNGPNAALSSSLLNFSVVQPLLAGGGRDIGLEQLTFFERSLLANLRSYSQFRQGFYTQVVIGDQGVSGPSGASRGANISVFGGRAGLGGYVGLLEQLQQIRNSEDNLSLQLRTLAQLEALLDAGIIDLVQVDQFRQNVERERANLLQATNNYQNALDEYKTGTLGLPPDLEIELDDSLIRRFQLVGRDATGVQDRISELQDRLGILAETPTEDALKALQEEVVELLGPVREQLELAESDRDSVSKSIEARGDTLTNEEKDGLSDELENLDSQLKDLNDQFKDIQLNVEKLGKGNTDLIRRDDESMIKVATDPLALDNADDWDSNPMASEGDPGAEREESEGEGLLLPRAQANDSGEKTELRRTVVILRQMLRLVQGAILVQARSRLEAVSVETIELESEEAFRIALGNRLDFMNGRAALVDTWRLIQVNADALQSILTFRASGDIASAKNNPVNFRGSTGNARLGVEFDAPFTRLIERNTYRASLINYQRDRRAYIQSRDSLHQGLRILLREIEQLRLNLEIQRRAVAIAIRRVDLTRAALYAPVPPPQPGARVAQFGPTAAINLLSAQSALRDTQNAFLGVWLDYYAARTRLARELGVMILDQNGRWVEESSDATPSVPLDEDAGFIESDRVENQEAAMTLPPALPDGLVETVESLPEDFEFEAPADGPPEAPSALQLDDALIE